VQEELAADVVVHGHRRPLSHQLHLRPARAEASNSCGYDIYIGLSAADTRAHPLPRRILGPVHLHDLRIGRSGQWWRARRMASMAWAPHLHLRPALERARRFRRVCRGHGRRRGCWLLGSRRRRHGDRRGGQLRDGRALNSGSRRQTTTNACTRSRNACASFNE
jgi:hypothetical protein